jgi:hypothetical protein
VCFAVRIVVAAPTRERRLELRRAAVSAEWEVVADAQAAGQAVDKATTLRARILVVDAATAGSQRIADGLAGARPGMFLVGVGDVAGADASVAPDGLANLRAVLADLLHGSGDHVH